MLLVFISTSCWLTAARHTSYVFGSGYPLQLHARYARDCTSGSNFKDLGESKRIYEKQKLRKRYTNVLLGRCKA